LTAASKALAVIPCLNERDEIGPLIQRLLEDPDWADPLVVVADGGSTDDTREQAAQIAAGDPRVRLVHNERRVQSSAVNLAAALHGQGRRWLVRVDAHAQYPRGYVSNLIKEAERTGASSVVVSMHTHGRHCFQRAAAHAQNSWLGTGGAAHRMGGKEGFVDHGHHALFDLAAFQAAGGYDESFTHNEDAELDVRLRKAGGRIWLTRAVEIVYLPRSSPWPLLRQYFSYGWGRARTLRRHRERPRLRQMAPLLVAPALAALALAPAWPAAAAPAGAWAAACCLYGVALSARRRSRCALLSGPAAMIMHAGWSAGFWAQLLVGRRGSPVAPRPLAGRATP
jgi:succinoglycan biosynthesis protein ExoA